MTVFLPCMQLSKTWMLHISQEYWAFDISYSKFITIHIISSFLTWNSEFEFFRLEISSNGRKNVKNRKKRYNNNKFLSLWNTFGDLKRWNSIIHTFICLLRFKSVHAIASNTNINQQSAITAVFACVRKFVQIFGQLHFFFFKKKNCKQVFFQMIAFLLHMHVMPNTFFTHSIHFFWFEFQSVTNLNWNYEHFIHSHIDRDWCQCIKNFSSSKNCIQW